MGKSRSIPKELIKHEANKIWRKRQRIGRDGTAESDWRDARQDLEKKYLIVIFLWKVNTPVRLFRNFWSLFGDTNNRAFALDIVKTFISAFGLIATVLAGIGLFLNYQGDREDRRLTQERLATERFSKAVEQLGKYKDREGKIPDTTVRLGGIYALEHIAEWH